MSALLFGLICLAAYRATRLVTTDTLFDRQREWLFDRFPPNDMRGRTRYAWVAGTGWRRPVKVAVQRPQGEWRRTSKLGQLVECPWCCGFWFAGAVTAAAAQAARVPLPLLVWPAAATAVGLLGAVDEWLRRP